jgi:hypothetical protein
VAASPHNIFGPLYSTTYMGTSIAYVLNIL